jgi:hypothetical protein
MKQATKLVLALIVAGWCASVSSADTLNDSSPRPPSVVNLALQAYRAGDYRRAEVSARQWLAGMQILRPPGDPEVADAMHLLGMVCNRQTNPSVQSSWRGDEVGG